jgi:formylglycine-generating enzyme required for sulfatase activity/tRNA A-37 threonylcarbamoyl transferase component Bud32
MVPVHNDGSHEVNIAFSAGDRVSSRYTIEDRLGKGGMGVVYRAHDSFLNEKVALKFMHPGLLRTQRGQQLFIQEAQLARRLRHDNIVAVHDAGRTGDGILYLSMEFLKGYSLRAFLRQRRNERKLLDVRLVVTLTSAVLDALKYAHQFVVHRDLKPENLMLIPGERVKILDFGLARALEAEAQIVDDSMVDSGRIIGTEAYAAPEQTRHSNVDLRADLYAVGLLLREMLTLRTPVEEPTQVAEVRGDVAPSLLAVLDKALRIEKENRWQSAGEFRHALVKAYRESYQPQALPAAAVQSDRVVSTKDMVYLDGGSFLMGSNEHSEEAPQSEVNVDPFYIDIFPVTNEKYAEFLQDSGHAEPKFWRNPELNGPQQPVVGVTWAEAAAYAAWAGKQLLTEAQWEFAARGKQNRRYPWGVHEPDQTRANYGDYLNMPSIVAMHEDGMTPEGIYDLAGNVYEWTADLLLPYDPAKRQAAMKAGEVRRVVRGGSWHSPQSELRCTFRRGFFPESQVATVGFRCGLPARTAEK